jgi:hypothetical protein
MTKTPTHQCQALTTKMSAGRMKHNYQCSRDAIDNDDYCAWHIKKVLEVCAIKASPEAQARRAALLKSLNMENK